MILALPFSVGIGSIAHLICVGYALKSVRSQHCFLIQGQSVDCKCLHGWSTANPTMSACLDVGPTKLSYAGFTNRRYLQRVKLVHGDIENHTNTYCSSTPSTLLPLSLTSLSILRANIISESHWTKIYCNEY
jgi:hypothetical protein